jgi:hypothetical protein
MPKKQVHADGKKREDDLAETFHKLVDRWKHESLLMSSPMEMASLPSYLQIIELGKPILPLLLEELQRDPDHWFRALTALTGENPVPPSAAGKLHEMTAAWLEWGKRHGYIKSRARRVS